MSKLLAVVVVVMVFCFAAKGEDISEREVEMSIKVTSEAFEDGGLIPVKYTCDGEDISPALSWGPLPADTKSVAVIVDDPDAPMGTFVHWVLYNLPADTTELAAGVEAEETHEDGTRQGVNDFGDIGYGGPCPPKGKPHRYYFKVYAVDVVVDTTHVEDKESLLKRIDGHILAKGELVGHYARQ